MATRTDAESSRGPRATPRADGRRRLRLALVALLLVALSVATGLLVRDYFTVGEVALPDLVGLSFEEASRALREAELVVDTYSDNVPTLPPGVVTSQTPAAGVVVRRGRSVGIGVNAPPEDARAPTLVGLELAEAERLMADLNRAIGGVTYVASDRTAGLVVGQEPAAGAVLTVGEPLRLRVSRGPEVAEVAMPDVVGLDIAQARERLSALGFTRVEAVASSLSFDRAGEVESQLPAPGSVVPVSAPITLEYALASGRVVQVPDLGGLPLWRAQLALRARGLRVGNVAYVDDPERPDGVVGTSPWTYTPPGSPVALTVNGEPGGANFLLDDGPSELATPDDLSDLLGRDSGARDTDDLDGAADSLRRTLPTGNDAQRGLGTAPDPPRLAPSGQRTVPFSFDPARFGVASLLDEPYRLELVVRDERGERTVLDREIPAGQAVSTSVTVEGSDVLLQTFINGAPFQAWRP